MGSDLAAVLVSFYKDLRGYLVTYVLCSRAGDPCVRSVGYEEIIIITAATVERNIIGQGS